MRIAGVEMPASTAAELVVLLERAGHTALGQRLGIAVDREVSTLTLLPGDGRRILHAVRDASGKLAELRGALTGGQEDMTRSELA